MRLGHVGNSSTVHQHMLRNNGQIGERDAHRQQTRMIDIDAIDFVDLDQADTDR